jgi:transglutaminase-like putative cysteine protease
MDKWIFSRLFLFCGLTLFLYFLTGCSDAADSTSQDDSSTTYTWERTMRIPVADQTETIGDDVLSIDISNKELGYMMIRYQGTAQKANVQVTAPDGTIDKYFLTPSDDYTPFPFTGGDGNYIIAAFENIEGDQYASLFTEIVDVSLENQFLPYLYPNQYVNFTEDSQAVKLAASLADSAESDLDFLTEVYHYVVEHVSYDEDKAQNVELGYLPDIDETLSSGKGICFDYAALMTAMLRSQGIPCKMAVGYSNDVKHSWIDVFIEGSGWIDHAIELDSDEWKLLDPTFASSNPDDDTVKDYIGDGSNYILQYNE